MAERNGEWSDRVALIEKKVDSLAALVDVRFEEVGGALLEQRRYTEFAFDQLNTRIGQLEQKMDSGFAGVDSGFAGVNSGFAGWIPASLGWIPASLSWRKRWIPASRRWIPTSPGWSGSLTG